VTGRWEAVAELIGREAGIALPPERRPALQAAVARAAPGLDPAAVLRAAADPRTGPGLVDRLIDEVTVQESSFLRDAGQFEAISWHRLRANAAGTIRVWSAGCAAGEEAYTLALLAAEAFGAKATPVDVLGTDISRAALAAADAGRYRERAVRALSASARRRYLEQEPDGTSVVGDRLRALVRFQRHNLARGPVPPPGEAAFDLIVCRNVLIYFAMPVVERMSRMLERAVRPGGVLLLGAADVLCRTAAYASPAGAGQAGARAARAPEPSAARLTRRPASPPQPAGPTRPAGPTQPAAPTHAADSRRTAHPRQPPSQPRPAAARSPAGPREQQLRQALDAAGRGDGDQALELVTSMVTADPLDADFHFLHGLLALEAGDPARARDALRRALCADPPFGLAAFALGRAYDALGDRAAGRRAYQQALRLLDPGDDSREALLQQIDMGDIAAACRARLEGHQ
jgi:chemotaxis protein methyltransferase CheR